MNRRTKARIKQAQDAARSELKQFGWDTLHMHERFPYTPAFRTREDVERVDATSMSREAFVERYERANRPVILTGLTERWTAHRKWTLHRLAKKYRNQKFKCGEDDDGRSVRMKMKYFMEYIEHGKDDSPLYIFDSSFAERHKVKRLREDYEVPTMFEDDLFNYAPVKRRPPHRWFVMGPARSGTNIHVDPLSTSAWNSLISGHKLWVLIPPGAPRDLVKATKGEGGKHYNEAIAWFNIVYPRTKSAEWPSEYKALECIQKAGETMFVPSGWWHVVINLDTTIAVTQNFCSITNLPRVWAHTARSRPKFSRVWYKQLRTSRPELAKVCDSISSATIENMSHSSSSDSSSSSSSSDESDSSNPEQVVPPPSTAKADNGDRREQLSDLESNERNSPRKRRNVETDARQCSN